MKVLSVINVSDFTFDELDNLCGMLISDGYSVAIEASFDGVWVIAQEIIADFIEA